MPEPEVEVLGCVAVASKRELGLGDRGRDIVGLPNRPSFTQGIQRFLVVPRLERADALAKQSLQPSIQLSSSVASAGTVAKLPIRTAISLTARPS
jgi:hypothetical protein